jgi:hypothetical protein
VKAFVKLPVETVLRGETLCSQVAFSIPIERFVGSMNFTGAPDLSN